MNFMKTILLVLSFPLSVFAEGEGCFPISRARHDRECYDFDSKDDCLKRDDIFSCGWGQKSANAPSDDEMLVCDDSRCSNNKDGDGPEFYDEEG